MSQPPKNRPPTKTPRPPGSGNSSGYGNSSRGYSNPPPKDYRNVRPRYVQQQRDPFPYIMGGVIGALVVGLMLVIFLLLSNNNKNNTPQLAVEPSGTPQPTAAAGSDPPRMALDEFKTLYDDPAKRPLIIDVRAAASFDEGHIAGAISFPEADVDTRVNEIPKDKLVVAYCQ